MPLATENVSSPFSLLPPLLFSHHNPLLLYFMYLVFYFYYFTVIFYLIMSRLGKLQARSAVMWQPDVT